MFARVSTAHAGAGGFDSAICRAREQLPAARQLAGYAMYNVIRYSRSW